MITEPGEYSDESRDKLEELRYESEKAERRKTKNRMGLERALDEANKKPAADPSKIVAPILALLVTAALLVIAYFVVESMELDKRSMMISGSDFSEAGERIKQNPNILKASFHQELESVQQIEMELYIDYMVVDQRAREIGSEVMKMLGTSQEGAEIEEDELGSRLYSYQIVMKRLDDREVARGMLESRSSQVIWE